MDRRHFIVGSLGATSVAGPAGLLLPAHAQAQTITPTPPQFLSWDAGSGPTNTYWSTKLALPWRHRGTGDWLDAGQREQGGTPYATASVSARGPVKVVVTALVARWLANGLNRGFYLSSRQNFPIVFHGRESENAAARPVLVVTTDRGVFTAPCLANARFAASTAVGYDSRARFQVARAHTFALVQFDLAGITGTVLSAVLQLHCDALTYAGQIDLFEANPPLFRDGGGGAPARQGLASSYVLDEGLAGHPSVLLSTDFADLSPWNVGKAENAIPVYDPATRSTYLRGVIRANDLGSCTLEREVVRSATRAGVPTSVETELFARYYVYLEPFWGSKVDANKMPGWDGRMGWWNPAGRGYWATTTGNGGSKPTGLKVWNAKLGGWEYQGASMRGHGGMRAGDGNPYDDQFWMGTYMYHLDQVGPYGESVRWDGTVLSRGRWYCIEQQIKMNTISGPYDAVGNGVANHDGEYRVWVDGVLAWERTNFRWRRHPEMGIQGFWLNWYHGGTDPAPLDMQYRMNSVVIAREYIGPRRTPGG